jgi:hypothetical protein
MIITLKDHRGIVEYKATKILTEKYFGGEMLIVNGYKFIKSKQAYSKSETCIASLDHILELYPEFNID